MEVSHIQVTFEAMKYFGLLMGKFFLKNRKGVKIEKQINPHGNTNI